MAIFQKSNQTLNGSSSQTTDTFGLITADDFINFEPYQATPSDRKSRRTFRPNYGILLVVAAFVLTLAAGAFVFRNSTMGTGSLAVQYLEFGVMRGKEDFDHRMHQAYDVDDPSTAMNYLEGDVSWRKDSEQQKELKQRLVGLPSDKQKEYLKQFAKGYKIGYLQYKP